MLKTIENKSPLLLKIAIICLGIPVLFAMVFVIYNIVTGIFLSDAPWFIFPPFILFVLSCFPTLYALVPSFKLVQQVEKQSFFTELSIDYLQRIKVSAWIVGLIFVLEMPFWYMIAQWDDAPGLILYMLFIAGLSFTIGFFAVVLQSIVVQGIDKIQS